MHFIKWAASLILIFFLAPLTGQQILVDDSELDFRQLSFQPDFIVRNNIKSIAVTEREMRYGQPIKELGSGITYTFDEKGNCISRSTSLNLFGRQDTIVERFELKGRELERSIRQDQRSYLRLEREVFGDTTSFCRYRGNAQGEETWLSCEYHVKQKEVNKEVLQIMNDQKRPYHKKVFHYDSLGYLVLIEETFLVTRNASKSEFIYTETGQLKERKDTSTKGTKQWEYIYSEDGMLESIYYYEDGKLIWEREIVLGNSGKIDALLKRDPDTGDIRIDKYTYEFFD